MANADHVQRFLSKRSCELKKFLRERGIPVGNGNHEELAEKAFWAEKLGLQVKPSDEEAEEEIHNSRSQKLVLDGGLIHLPRPETIANGWEDGPRSLPDTCRDHLDSYIKAGKLKTIFLSKFKATLTAKFMQQRTVRKLQTGVLSRIFKQFCHFLTAWRSEKKMTKLLKIRDKTPV